MNKFFVVLIVITLCFATFSCGYYNAPSPTQNPNSYSLKKQILLPSFRFYHTSDDSTTLFFKINSNNLLYVRASEKEDFKANFVIRYETYDELNRKTILDSASTTIQDVNKNQVQKNIIGKIELPLLSNKNYHITIHFDDKNRKQEYSKQFIINKENTFSRENFLPVKAITHTPVFEDYIDSPDSVYFASVRNKNKVITQRYYHNDFGLPPPPFSRSVRKPFDYNNTQVEDLQIDENGILTVFPDAYGMYHFTIDSISKHGYTFYMYNEGYPKVNQETHLSEPLRYLTTKKEYENLVNSDDTKKAIDEFWIDCGGSRERARNLIRHYYNRVKEANYFFTSYVEGWKTDRGLIHIIYGKPKHIYVYPNSETWIYGEETNSLSLTFTFTRVLNPFTNNDFSLNRNDIFKGSWYRAVDSWRLGRIYGQ